MNDSTFYLIGEIGYAICQIAFLVLPLYLLPYSIKKLKDWSKTVNEESLRKGCIGCMLSLISFVLFILLIIKKYHF